ncbi:hypothetical protein ACFQE8_03830 [Salinirubellus sp. GCM10025818]|jgi:hypothetical protein|uniref:hypothetical protein n=1 Tax=Salinirubellus TaxID=2162630 RepID=UPI0030D3F430
MTSRGGRLLGVLLAVAVVLSVVPGAVLAQDAGDGDDADDVNVDRLVEVYNANTDQAPGIVRGRLAGRSVELRVGEGSTVASADTGTVYHFTTAEDGTITDYGEGAAEDPDYRALTSEDAFFAVLDASDPAAEFERQRRAGDIRINGVGVTNTVVVEGAKFAGWVGKSTGLF